MGLTCLAKSIFAGAVEPEFEGLLMPTLASIGEAVLDVVLPQPLRPEAAANARITIAARMDAY